MFHLLIRCVIFKLCVLTRLSPGDFVLDGDLAPPPKGGGAPPNFWPTSIVVKRLHGPRCHSTRQDFFKHWVPLNMKSSGNSKNIGLHYPFGSNVGPHLLHF